MTYRSIFTKVFMLLYCLVVASFMVGCIVWDHRVERSGNAYEDSLNMPKMKYTNWRTAIDTTCNDWRIIVREADNELTTEDEQEDTIYTDKSCFISIYKNGKLVFDKKEVNAPLLFDSFSSIGYLLSTAIVQFVTNSTVYINIGAYMPESDDGRTCIYAFSKNGVMAKYLIRCVANSLQDDPVNSFYTMCTHELMQKNVDKTSLHQIAREYCTASLVDELDKKGYLSIFPAKITSKGLPNVDFATDDYDLPLEPSKNNNTYIGNKKVEERAILVRFYKKETIILVDSIGAELDVTENSPFKIKRIFKMKK